MTADAVDPLRPRKTDIMKKLISFLHEIGTIMYVGGILSHIVIGIIFSHSDPETTITVYTYKLQSAYILILSGLGIKIITDLILWFGYGEHAWWMRVKLASTAFLDLKGRETLIGMSNVKPSITGMVIGTVKSGLSKPERAEASHA